MEHICILYRFILIIFMNLMSIMLIFNQIRIDILINNLRMCYHIKDIHLSKVSKYNFDLVKELKMKMSKLTLIDLIVMT